VSPSTVTWEAPLPGPSLLGNLGDTLENSAAPGRRGIADQLANTNIFIPIGARSAPIPNRRNVPSSHQS